MQHACQPAKPWLKEGLVLITVHCYVMLLVFSTRLSCDQTWLVLLGAGHLVVKLCA